MTVSAIVPITGSYDYSEVARSVLIAIAASYAALDLTGRVAAARGQVRLAWLSGGAIAMGIGIWAMHIKGVLAFHLPVLIKYHWPTLLAALLVAIFASVVALYLTSRQKMGWVEALTGSIVMGAGIASLHYIAMAAMRLPAIIRYSPLLVTASLLLAVLFSLIALLMAFDLRQETRWTVPRRLGSAIVMGAAVSAMHYTGMAAANFFPASPPSLSHTVSITPVGGSGVVIATLIDSRPPSLPRLWTGARAPKFCGSTRTWSAALPSGPYSLKRSTNRWERKSPSVSGRRKPSEPVSGSCTRSQSNWRPNAPA